MDQEMRCTGSGWGGVNLLHSSRVMPCFGFVTKTMLTMQGCFSYG